MRVHPWGVVALLVVAWSSTSLPPLAPSLPVSLPETSSGPAWFAAVEHQIARDMADAWVGDGEA